jgi:hypothetical protein
MALTAAKIARMVAARGRARAGRTETVTIVAAGSGTVGYQAVDVVWADRHDAGQVRVPYGLVPGVTSRTSWGVATWDASIDVDPGVTIPADVRYVARTPTTGGIPTAARYVIQDIDRVTVAGTLLAQRVRLRRTE